jgi:hypothetical protein
VELPRSQGTSKYNNDSSRLYYYFRLKKTETPKPKPERPKMTEKKKKDIFGSLRAEYDETNNVLTIDSVLSILNGVLELTMPDHAELIVKNRTGTSLFYV